MNKGTYNDQRKTLGFGGLLSSRLGDSGYSLWHANRIRPQSRFRSAPGPVTATCALQQNTGGDKYEHKVNLNDVSGQLLALLEPATLVFSNRTPWASVTFTGYREVMGLSIKGEAAERRVAQFADLYSAHEFDMTGQIVADIIITRNAPVSEGVMLVLEVLVVND
jgi:hypothetical protein